MAIWPFQGKNNHTVHVNSLFNLDELEYAFEFSDDEGILLETADTSDWNDRLEGR